MGLHPDSAENASAFRRICRGRTALRKAGGCLPVFAAGALLFLGMLFASPSAQGEYGDVVISRQAESLGRRPVIFSHTFHRIRFQCRVCHTELGFKMRAGDNEISMFDIFDGRYCGACHNGSIAWGLEDCNLCHSGKPGLKKGVVGGDKTGGPGLW